MSWLFSQYSFSLTLIQGVFCEIFRCWRSYRLHHKHIQLWSESCYRLSYDTWSELNEFDSWVTPALSTRGTTASKLSRSFPSPFISSPAYRLLVPCWDFIILQNGHSLPSKDLFQFHDSIDIFANQCPSSSPTMLSFCLAIGGVNPVFSVIARLQAHF